MPERNQLHAASLRRRPLPFVPAAFRADDDGCIVRRWHTAKHAQRFRVDVDPRLDQHQPHRGGRLVEIRFESQRCPNLGQHGAPRLFHRGQRHPAPPVGAGAAEQGGDGHFRAARHDRLYCSHAEHHGVADHVVHLVALQNGLHERHRHRQFVSRLDARQKLEADIAADCANDPGQVFLTAPIEDGDFVPGGDAQDSSEVLRLVTREHNGLVPGIQGWREETVHGGGL